ncbi:MAG: alpha/beta hydrolase [Tahibacter sp.]
MQHPILKLVFLTIASAIGDAAVAEGSTTAIQPDPALDVYARAAQRVDIGSARRLNLRCTGNGNPAVVLEAGFGADSLAWSKLQPLLSAKLRVCSYDRAGYGFSDIGPMPRDLDAEVADLHALIHAAKIHVPAILVGHSMGSNIVRSYDQRYPDDVAALVLIDPPPQNIAEFSTAYVAAEAEMVPAMMETYRSCEQAAKEGKLAAPAAELQRCLRGANPAYSDTLNAATRSYRSSPAFWATVRSGAEAKVHVFDRPVPPDEKHGAKPLVVLTAVDAYAEAPPDDRKALEAAQAQTHAALAATSTLGKRILVHKTSHDLQLDDPSAAFDAIVEAREHVAR